MKKVERFSVFKNEDGEYFREQNEKKDLTEVKLQSVRPSHKHNQKAQEVYTKRWRELSEQGVPLRIELDEILKQRKLWNEEQEKKDKELNHKIAVNLNKLQKGGKVSEGIKLAKQGIKDRTELLFLRLNRNQLEQNTAEAIAQQERFNYLVSVCTVYEEDGSPFFDSHERYYELDNEGNPVPTIAGEAFFRLTSGENEDFRKEWPEYKFLLKFKIVDDKLRFKTKDGFTDLDGNLVDEEGRLINKEGQFVDLNQNQLDENGRFVIGSNFEDDVHEGLEKELVSV